MEKILTISKIFSLIAALYKLLKANGVRSNSPFLEKSAVRILDKIKSDGVYIYPALFDNDGTLNNDLIQDLGELTYGDNN